jgi:hypothetical protein
MVDAGSAGAGGGMMKIALGIFLLCFPFVILTTYFIKQYGLAKTLMAWGAALPITLCIAVGGFLLFE